MNLYGELMSDTVVLPAIRRLVDAHQHWMQAEKYYFDPNKFRIEINSLIQTLRNVTFALQNVKHHIPDFDSWYGKWQEKMRADEHLRWLVNARNKIVKQGDLELFSILRVSILGSYRDDEVPYKEFKLSPSLTNKFILMDAKKSGVPKEILKDAYLKIERRWIEKEDPKTEMLEKLAHCWAVLGEVLLDAQRQCGEEIGEKLEISGPPLCMKKYSETRSQWMKVSSGKIDDLAMKSVKMTDKISNRAKERYKIPESPQAPESLRGKCNFFFSMAREVLQKDGYHITIAAIFHDHHIKFVQIAPEDQADKFRMMRVIADEVEVLRATSLIFIGEIWMAKFDPSHPFRRAAESPERTEALQLIGMSIDGERIVLIAPFKKVKKKVVLEETIESSYEGTNILAPVESLWARWKKDHS